MRMLRLGARWPARLARALATAAGDERRRLVKRKVAIVGGYLGTGYHGVQLNKDVDTIEDELRRAILAAGAMRESNFEDLAKIDWSRSSRTDKGVHAGCIVFSGKLLIDEDKAVEGSTGRVKGLAQALNDALPPSIRIFSCTRVNKRFAARKNCVLREYEYFMPLSFLKKSLVAHKGADGKELDVDAAVARFTEVLRQYEGIHDFHNFTKARSYFYKSHAKMEALKKAQQEADSDEDGEDEEEENGETGEDEYQASATQFADEGETSRKLLPRHRRAIYSCSGSIVEDFHGEPYLRVHIVGQAFLFNQIRCMVGGALAVATNALSQTAFRAALDTNRIVRIPVAPAEGLVLLSSTFGGKLHTVSLYEDPNTILARERRDLSHRVLLSQKEDAEMRKFREEFIYKEIAKNWKDETKVERWQAYLERVYESNEHLEDNELAEVLAGLQQQWQEIAEKRQAFVHRNRVGMTEKGTQGALLPKQFTTKLCVRFAVAPGIFTSDLRRGVSKHIKGGNIPSNATEEDIMSYIEDYGVAKMAEEGRKMRLSIRT